MDEVHLSLPVVLEEDNLMFSESPREIRPSLTKYSDEVRPLSDVGLWFTNLHDAAVDTASDTNASKKTGKYEVHTSRKWAEDDTGKWKEGWARQGKGKFGERMDTYRMVKNLERKRAIKTRTETKTVKKAVHISKVGTFVTRKSKELVSLADERRVEAMRPGLEAGHISPTMGKFLPSLDNEGLVDGRALNNTLDTSCTSSEVRLGIPVFKDSASRVPVSVIWVSSFAKHTLSSK